MKASSHLDESHQASHGRLNGTGWCAGNASSQDWLQIDFNRTIDVCAVATQGGANGWMTKFRLLFSNNGRQWVPYEQEDGSIMHFDRSGKNVTIDQHKLPKTVSARHVRFIPNLQHVWNCLKVEVYGFDDPCYNHDVLSQAKRKKTFEGAGGQCDRKILPSEKKWFRFVEPAGTQMPTACVPLSHCNADRPGWLDGHHPNVTQGVVNMRVCFTSENDCCGDQIFISVKNCGDFFAYGLVKPRSCGRYCGE
nr:neuropilin-1-like [Pocillopora verrucosa]